MARMPLKTLALVPAVFAFGFVLDEQRLDDRTPAYAIDHEMDARLTPYVPLVRAGLEADRLSDGELLTLARRWRKGRLSGLLRDPMPASYGNGEGARSDLVCEAVRLACALATRGRTQGNQEKAKAMFAGAVEPLRAVQYADLGTLAKVETRRNWLCAEMREYGFSADEAEETTKSLRPNGDRMKVLLRHMARLRNRFRVRFDDEEALWIADPFFEALVRGSGKGRLTQR